MNELTELIELGHALRDTQVCAGAVVELREELRALGCTVAVDWRSVAAAQREVEFRYLEIFEAIRAQARSSIR